MARTKHILVAILPRRIVHVLYQAVAYLLLALPAVVQAQTFAKITIKSAHSADQRNMRMQVLPGGDLSAKAVPVIMLLSYAYDVPINPSSRLSPLPDWTIRERYDIEAKAPANAMISTLSDSEAHSRVQQMIRRLLADRFRLVMRAENKTMSVYALAVARGGSKLEKSAVTSKDCIFDTDPEGCHTFIAGFGHPLNAKAIDMDDLAHYLGNWTDMPVVNRTALRGLFTLHTEGWVPMQLPPPPPNGTTDANQFARLPTIFTVLRGVGLEMKRQEDILPVYAVERIERPAAN